MASKLTPAQMGRKGGTARGVRLRAGEIPITGAAVPKPTACPRCGEVLPTHRESRAHCRKSRKEATT